MLEDRPVTQKALIGAAAFMFVFSAAMAGTGFMMSGGFGVSDAQAGVSSGPSESYLQLGQTTDQTPGSQQRNSLQTWERDLRRDAVLTPASGTVEPDAASVAQ